MSGEAIGKLETNEHTMGLSGGKIENGVDSRDSGPMANSEVGNPTMRICEIEERNKDLIPGSSSNVREARNFSEGVRGMGREK